MDRFIVSARKYRPTLFKEMKGQEQVITTLLNQLKKHTVAQVVLFCGPRGSGKTSCARLLAKAINCEDMRPSGEPCNACTSCHQFQQQTSVNIHELDAASHNSVDDARQLLDQIRYHPAAGKKVFIIDEVHMLSNAAFNTLLKTLEEPPAHVVFILATTEKHKIIPTILSRCQIFDFHPIPEQQLVAQLKYIAQQEGIEASEEALHLISEQSEGSFREALHSFDKIVAFEGGKSLTQEGVLRNLQILDYKHFFSLTEALDTGNTEAALLTYDKILRLGFDNQHFLLGLSRHLRNLLVAQTSSAPTLLQAAPSIAQAYQEQAGRVSLDFLHRALPVLEQCELHYKERQDKRLHVEITLIKLALLTGKKPTKEAVSQSPSHTPTQPPSGSPTPVTPAKAPVATAPKQRPHSSSPAPPTPHVSAPATPPSIEKKAPTPSAEPTAKSSSADSLELSAVRALWLAYSQQLKKQRSMAAYATMQSPISLEGEKITVQISNPLQKNALRQIHDPLLAYLREHLSCPSLTLTSQLLSPAQEVQKPYTNKEKLHQIVERYPAVAHLQKALELEC